MTAIERLMQAERPFLTDGGFETWLFFHEGLEAPEFAAIALMDEPAARVAMRAYFERFLGQAEAAGVGYVLDTNTWRGCVSWAPKLGRTRSDLLRLSADAAAFARELRDAWRGRVDPIIVNGVIGPAGDGYSASDLPNAGAARAAHWQQVRTLARSGVDMISAITMTGSIEAAGVAQAATDHGLPVALSFTLETDARLPSGETLGGAIAATDALTGGAPLYYMINCAHPTHFRDALKSGERWIERIGGVRANASRLSHAELDAAEALDEGDPEEFGALHLELAALLPNLRVVGGCCGTDHRHVGCVSRHLHHHAEAA